MGRRRVEESLLALMKSRSRPVQTIRAAVGDGCGNTAVPGDTNYVWIRPYNRDYPVRAYTPAGAGLYYDTIVLADIHHVGGATYYVVRGLDPETYSRESLPAGVPTTSAHALQHMYDAGGGDVVYVHPWQMTPLRLTANNPESMSVYVSPAEWWSGGTLHMWPGGETASLASYVPSTGHVKYVVVYILTGFDALGYEESPEYVDGPYLPSIYDINIPTPAGAIAAGLVRLNDDTTAISTNLIYPIRTIITPDYGTELAQRSMFLAVQEDAFYKSTAGLYTWTQYGSGDPYLTSGITGVVCCSSTHWVVFRGQTVSHVDNPFVYVTTNAGISWAKSQTGMTIVQGTDYFKVYAVWRDYDDPFKIVIAVSRVGVSMAPRIFSTTDGGLNWTEVSNTGLPSFTCDSTTYPRSIAVQSIVTPVMCIALGPQEMYYKNGAANWALKTLNGEAVFAVREDTINSAYWLATTNGKVYTTLDNWTTNTMQQLTGMDAAATDTVGIYQNQTDKRRFVVAGQASLHTTWTRGEYSQSLLPIGECGAVLHSVPGASSLLLLTDVDKKLYMSCDGGLTAIMSLALTDVIAADGLAPR